MIDRYKDLPEFAPAGMSGPHKPWYFPCYGCLGMHLVGQEFKEEEQFRNDKAGYIADTQKELLAWQQKDGSWPNQGWILDQEKGESSAHGTTFATLMLCVPEGQRSIYNRVPPRLPEAPKE